jgi:uncharacterized OB-fold protein
LKDLSNEGTIRAYTIVHRAAPSVGAPYTSVIVNLDGGGVVKANLLGASEPSQIVPGTRVSLTTFVAGSDGDGNEAIAFGYRLTGEHDE